MSDQEIKTEEAAPAEEAPQTDEKAVDEVKTEEAEAEEEVKEEESEDEVEYECPEEFNTREEMCKMFVGGLDKTTTDEEFKELFAEHGEIKDFIIIRKENSKSDRLFGFITFAQCDDLERCLLKRPHNYKSKELDVKRAVPKSAGNDEQGHYKVKKLHVANLPPDFKVKTLRRYLKARHSEEFGKIEDINFLTKEEGGKIVNKGFGFINVSTEDFADRIAIGENKFTLDNNALRISKAKPRSQGGFRGGRGGSNFNNYGNYGGGYNQNQYNQYDGGFGYGGGYGYGGYGGYGGAYGGYGGYAYQGGRGGGNSRYKPY